MRSGLLLGFSALLLVAGCGEKDNPTDSDPGAVDEDQDGYDASEDCDDQDADIHPGAAELCDQVDQDCDEAVDEGASTTLYPDEDGDGYGVDANTTEGCEVGNGWALQDGDCDDSDEAISPGAAEICDEAGVDEDCDGEANEADAEGATTYYPDEDGDGFGDEELGEASCTAISGRTTQGGDCDDNNEDVNPDAAEVCDDLDNDCDGEVNEAGAQGERTFYADADEDGYGDPELSQSACTAPSGTVDDDGDCDDADPNVNPGAAEICDNLIDDNCDSSPGACAWSGNYDLESEYHSRLYGEASNDQLGFSLQQGVGDDNGDGIPDLIVGARRNTSRTGAVYRMQGSGSFDRVASGANARMVGGETGEQFGERSAFVGDITGDGVDDVLVGAAENDVEDRDAGAAYLFEGTLLSGVADQDAIATWYGEARDDLAGYAVAGVGDLSGDGDVDLAIAAPVHDGGSGAVYIIEGPVTTSNAQTSLSAVGIKMSGAPANTFAGWWVAGGGDHNGDGQADLIVGAPGANGAQSSSGVAWVYEGPITASMSLDDYSAALEGQRTGDYTGGSLDWVSDFNGDGRDDLVVSAYENDTTGSNAGVAYLLYGPVSGDVSLMSQADVVFTGESSGDNAGYFVGDAGDVDGDGYVDDARNADLLIGAPEHGSGGRVYLFYGTSALSGTVSLSAADATFDGSSAGDDAGSVAMGIGDFNGDGLSDFVIGAPQWDASTSNGNGAVYLLVGGGF